MKALVKIKFLTSLELEFSEHEKDLKTQYEDLKEDSQKVEEVKMQIHKMKDEIVPLRLKTNMMSNKIDECKTLLINTNTSI